RGGRGGVGGGCGRGDEGGVAKEGLKTSLELLNAGKPLLLFPEGERTWQGTMQAFKPGLLLLIKRAPVPIVPVGIAGAFEAYPRGAKAPRFSPLFWPANGNAVAAPVGRPIDPARYAKMEREAILKDLFREVKAQVEVAERLVRKPEAPALRAPAALSSPAG